MAIIKKYLDEFDDFLRMADVEREVFISIKSQPLHVVVEGFAKDGSWLCYRVRFDRRSNLIQICYFELVEELRVSFKIKNGTMAVDSSWGKWENEEKWKKENC